jgi:hypothetical protein
MWPLLGLIFLPITTLLYVILWNTAGYGVDGWEWILVVLGVFADLASYGSSMYGRRPARAHWRIPPVGLLAGERKRSVAFPLAELPNAHHGRRPDSLTGGRRPRPHGHIPEEKAQPSAPSLIQYRTSSLHHAGRVSESLALSRIQVGTPPPPGLRGKARDGVYETGL